MMTRDDMLTHLRTAHEVALQAMGAGHHPFGAVLVGPDNAVLMRQGNVGTVRHAESELARSAAAEHARDFLWRCTLVTTFEPCAMCAGTIYWANIGTLVYGVAESTLFALTGDDPKNPTMRLPARTVFASGQKKIAIHGPFPELEDELIAPHRGFWRKA